MALYDIRYEFTNLQESFPICNKILIPGFEHYIYELTASSQCSHNMACLGEEELQHRKEQSQALQQKGQCTLLTNHLSSQNMEAVS